MRWQRDVLTFFGAHRSGSTDRRFAPVSMPKIEAAGAEQWPAGSRAPSRSTRVALWTVKRVRGGYRWHGCSSLASRGCERRSWLGRGCCGRSVWFYAGRYLFRAPAGIALGRRVAGTTDGDRVSVVQGIWDIGRRVRHRISNFFSSLIYFSTTFFFVASFFFCFFFFCFFFFLGGRPAGIGQRNRSGRLP